MSCELLGHGMCDITVWPDILVGIIFGGLI